MSWSEQMVLSQIIAYVAASQGHIILIIMATVGQELFLRFTFFC